MENKLSKKMWFGICLFSFMGGVAWNIENMYFNTFLYNSVYAGATSAAMAGTMAPTTAISRMVALSAIAAVVSTFIMGSYHSIIRLYHKRRCCWSFQHFR